MMQIPPLTETLVSVGEVMKDARDPWWILGSAAVAMHGADPGPVGDVDVLLSPADASRILPVLGIALERGDEHAQFRSETFAIWTALPLPVEFMASFRHLQQGEWLEVRPATREKVVLGGVTIFVPDRHELRRMLRDFGRPKDVERATRLAVLG